MLSLIQPIRTLTFANASKFVVICCVLMTGACDNSETEDAPEQIIGDPTPEQLRQLETDTKLSSGFGTPRADGTFSASLATIFKGSFEDDLGNGYAVELGRDDTRFSAMVGLLPGTDVGPLPKTGIASMRGTYSVSEVGKSKGDEREYGEVATTTGRILLRADFEFGTLQGSDGILSVDGEFTTQTLRGSAYFNSRQAALAGKVGQDRVIGIFHGADDESTFAGGFLVEP
ncbi:hypothetical protein [Planktotalea sp.]|uniref:hypothetical protein n=1 Tax=Planktotalea sp. TaxID=2029877 RepID=UPI003D6BE582